MNRLWYLTVGFVVGVVTTPSSGWAEGAQPPSDERAQVAVIDPRPMKNAANRRTELSLLEDSPTFATIIRDAVGASTRFTPVAEQRLRKSLGFYYRVDMFRCQEEPRCIVRRTRKLSKTGVGYVLASAFAYDADGRRVLFSIRLIDIERRARPVEITKWIDRGEPKKLKDELGALVTSLLEKSGTMPPPKPGEPGPDGGSEAADTGGETSAVEPGNGEAAAGSEKPAGEPTASAGSAVGGAEFRDEWATDIEDDFGAVETEDTVSDHVLEYGGGVKFQYFGYREDMGRGRVAGREDVDFSFGAKVGTKRASAYGNILARKDFADASRDRIEAEEAYIDLDAKVLSLRAGRTMVAWGAGNFFNPTDVINPFDFRDILASEKLGLWLVRLNLVLGPMAVETYFMPVFQPHLLPDVDGVDANGQPVIGNRWYPSLPSQQEGLELRYSFQRPKVPAPKLKNCQAAVRLVLSWLGADISLGYAYLIDRFPTIRMGQTLVEGPPTYMQLTTNTRYDRVHVVTFDLERAFGRLRIAGEAAAVITQDRNGHDPDIVNPYVTSEVGFDYLTGEFASENRLHFVFELNLTEMLVGDFSNSLSDFYRFPWKRAVLGRVGYQIGEEIEFAVNVIESLDGFDIMVNPVFEYDSSDVIKAQIGYVAMTGNTKNGTFHLYEANSRLTLAMEMRF